MLKIFGVPISQPVRAVVWACALKRLPAQLKPVIIGKSEKLLKGTRNPEYLEMNPAGTMPAIDDNGFTMGESNAILIYLSEKNGWTDLYPTDLQARAKVNQYLHFHHRNVREISAAMVAYKYTPGFKRPDEVNKFSEKPIKFGFKVLEQAYLGKGNKFLVGDKMTLADLSAYCEIGQLLPRFGNLWDFSQYPNVSAWTERMQEVEFHDEVHTACQSLGDLADVETVPMEKLVAANKVAIQACAKVLSGPPAA